MFQLIFLVFLCAGNSKGLLLDEGQLTAAEAHALNQRLEEEKAKRLLLENDVDALMKTVEALRRDVTLLKGAVDPDKVSQQAFMVRLTKSTSPGPNQTLIYDKVLVDLDNNYDVRHGTFTAKINGTYLFTVEACSGGGHFIHLSLQKNNVEMGTVLGGDDAYSDCSSNTFIFPLVVNDDVWVQHHGSSGDLTLVGYNENNFAGILIHPS